MTSHSRVLEFIQTIRESFKGSEIVYTQGSCYKFYKILKQVFPEAKTYYNSDHVLTEIGGKFYDITGEVKEVNHLLVDEHYSHEKLDKLIFNMDAWKDYDQELKEMQVYGSNIKGFHYSIGDQQWLLEFKNGTEAVMFGDKATMWEFVITESNE